jgi:hypothetical protein
MGAQLFLRRDLVRARPQIARLTCWAASPHVLQALARSVSQPTAVDVEPNANEPGAEPLWLTKPIEVEQGLESTLLSNFFRYVAVPRKAEAESD